MKAIFIKTILFIVLGTTLNVYAKEQVVLVHGAHFSGKAWEPLIASLRDTTNIVAVNLPNTQTALNGKDVTLTDYAQSLCSALRSSAGNIHLVVHSQGGAVAHQSLAICPQTLIKSITYVSAVAPLNGQKAFDLLSDSDYKNYMSAVELDENSHRMVIANKSAFIENFAQDATEKQQLFILDNVLPEPAYIGDEVIKVDPAQLAKIDKYYIFANLDRIISLKSQLNITQQIDLKRVYSLDTGHSPMATQPKRLADILAEILSQQREH